MNQDFPILNIVGSDSGCGSGSGCGSQSNSDSGCGSGCGCSSGPGVDSGLVEGLSEAEFLNSLRKFLEQASSVMLGAVSVTLLSGAAVENESSSDADLADANEANGEKPPVYAFLVDTEKCTGAGKCLTACREENNVPEGYARTWVERYIHLKDGTVIVDKVPETGYVDENKDTYKPEDVERSYFVPKLCNHCEDAPCNQVCPTHASITSPEGVELVDPDLCIGCSYCVQACPYGVRFINPETNNADKCTWCYHRITKGEQPACVEACPTGARSFGRLDDPNSEVRKILDAMPSSVLKEHLGTHPKLHYIGGLPKEVV